MPQNVSRVSVLALVMGVSAAMLGDDASAAPVAIGPAVAGPGDGLNSRWVHVGDVSTPHTIAASLSLLDPASTDPGILLVEEEVVPYVDFSDGEGGTDGTSGATTLNDLLTPRDPVTNAPTGDPHFALGFSGFLNIATAGAYVFRVHSDDGFRLSIGGETIIEFDGDRGPESTTSTPVDLETGLYEFSLIGWEQGIQFVHELTWMGAGSVDFTVPGDGDEKVFFTTPVPIPGALPLFAAAIAGLGVRRRRIFARP